MCTQKYNKTEQLVTKDKTLYSALQKKCKNWGMSSISSAD
jgi:hypothetical protein